MIKCDYQIAIIGGGVAGLSASNLLSKQGLKTVLIEKHKYPFNKVCGEYISLESLSLLKLIDFDYNNFDLPIINKLKLTAGNSSLKTKLPLGGIGVSRYFLDYKLMKNAIINGAEILEGTSVTEINQTNNYFQIKTNAGDICANVVLGAFGKKSNLDNSKPEKDKTRNFFAVKYHVSANLEPDQIELHIFKNGYCGISKVEGNKYCMCYMTTAKNLRECNNDIQKLEQNILSRNIFLKQYFTFNKKFIDYPVTISQIKSGIKDPVYKNMIMLGDAAGTIAPLCGNGISIAFHTAYLASQLIEDYFNYKYNYDQLLNNYKNEWNKLFNRRITTSRYFQNIFLNDKAAEFAINLLKYIPDIHAPLIKLTHGKNYIPG